jgi:hypothetical protein
VDAYAQRLWGQMEEMAGQPWFLGERFSALDIYVGAMTRWRPRRVRFAASCPRLHAIGLLADAEPRLAAHPNARNAARQAMSYPGRFITDDGHWRAKFSIRSLLFLIKIGQRPDEWLESIAVTTLGKAKGPACLTGPLFSFDGLLEADNVRSTKYVTSIGAVASELRSQSAREVL